MTPPASTSEIASAAPDEAVAVPDDAERPNDGPSALGWLAGPCCLVLLAGLAMPPLFGLGLPLLLVAVMVVVGERRVRRTEAVHARLTRGGGHPLARGALWLAALGSAAVLLTVLARAVGSVLVDVPAALWAVGICVLLGMVWWLVGARLPARARPVVLLLLAIAIPVAGVSGTRFEAEGTDAHGWAHGGPVLGIHPFQITSVMVDGYGPFDLPINDYVEPDGARGYGPASLAEALQRDLRAIATQTFADGPARARRALEDATVVAVQTPAVWERLDRPPLDEVQSRLLVTSGSFGRGSRVEFVCPGRRIEPRPVRNESLLNPMCPDKYAAEASAGLGVTGRWSGYTEGRGNDRLGLFRLWEVSRTDDKEGRALLERERRWWAWTSLALVGLCLLAPLRRVGEGVRGVAGALGLGAAAALTLAVLTGLGEPAIGMASVAAPWHRWTDPWLWTPALALSGLVLFAFEGPGPRARAPGTKTSGSARPTGHARLVTVPAVFVLVATLGIAVSLSTLGWIVPVHGEQGASFPLFVRGLSEVIGERGGLTIFEVEGAVASSLVVLMLGGMIATARVALAATTTLAPRWLSRFAWRLQRALVQRARDRVKQRGPLGPAKVLVVLAMVVLAGLAVLGRPAVRRAVAALGVLAVAAALVVSRKTAGAVALVPGVIGVTMVLGSGVLVLARKSVPDARTSEGWGGLGSLGRLAPVAWAGLGGLVLWTALAPLPSHPFVTACRVIGLLAVTAAGILPVVMPTRPAEAAPDPTPDAAPDRAPDAAPGPREPVSDAGSDEVSDAVPEAAPDPAAALDPEPSDPEAPPLERDGSPRL